FRRCSVAMWSCASVRYEKGQETRSFLERILLNSRPSCKGPRPPITSEFHFHSQLHLALGGAAERARRARQHRRDDADRGVADGRVRVGELRMVQQDERLDPELGLDVPD